MKSKKMPKHAAYQHVGMLKPVLLFCKDVVRQLEALKQTGIKEWDYGAEEDDYCLTMLDACIAEWQEGVDRVEAEMEFNLGPMGSRQAKGDDDLAGSGWYEVLPPDAPRQTYAYKKLIRAHAKAKAKAKAKKAWSSLEGGT